MFFICITAIISSISLSLISPVILWQRIVNLGDSLSHALIASFLVNFLFGFSIIISSLITAILYMAIVSYFTSKPEEKSLNLIVLSSFLIALTLFISDLYPGNFDVRNFIIGDVLASGYKEFFASLLLLVLILIFYGRNLNNIIILAISEDIAFARGINTKLLKFFINIILAISVAISIQIIGVLLMTSLLVIPAAISRNLSRNPISMLYYSVFTASCCSLIALFTSFNIDVSYSSVNSLVISILYISSIFYKKIKKL